MSKYIKRYARFFLDHRGSIICIGIVLAVLIYKRPISFTEQVGNYHEAISRVESIYGAVETSYGGYEGRVIPQYTIQSNEPATMREILNLFDGYTYHRTVFSPSVSDQVTTATIRISSHDLNPASNLYRIVVYQTGEVTMGSHTYQAGWFGMDGKRLYDQVYSYMQANGQAEEGASEGFF